ncbi:MarR family winged helix-turn-helix transcriptional regulator [Photobacterium galatheae]|uniref:MarR family transcriptional regulator n=1 Tax=Photobacterium galatheae TaxID=1654360 RepID=A0A066S0Z7_9GAMM|nr:MarR family transcriptional regulator [Photobacterium galatheae]KDM93303.1 MarR family transcriptional regulator [Photobacterium galatheae]MCM0150427.1 MarR family transcriptional regulator [Photobacterium galatheae]
MKYDHVDKLLAQWRECRPDLDCSPMGVIGRISRTSRIVDKQLLKAFKKHDLSAIEFDILATLRRTQSALTPTELYQTLMLSSGAMSTRIDALVKRGLIERIASAQDRRSCSVELTAAGVALVDQALEDHVENERNILEPLTADEQNELAVLLRKWLLHHEVSN